jgi:hypothetical protein
MEVILSILIPVSWELWKEKHKNFSTKGVICAYFLPAKNKEADRATGFGAWRALDV